MYVKGEWKIWKVRKRQGVIWRRTVGCVHSCLKYHVFYLVIVYYLLLKLPFVQGCIFGRSCSRYWCYCWRGGGCSIPFLVWFHTCQNDAKRNLAILCYSFYYMLKSILIPGVPIFKMTFCRTNIYFILIIIISILLSM